MSIFDFFTKRKQKHSVSVDAEQEQNTLLLERLGKVESELRGLKSEPRIASFVGTTNERHVLTDRTGSRRFLILEPDGIINVEGINHDQLYAQVLHEIEDLKLSHWFSKEDEAEMEKHNKDYYVLTDVERLFLRYFSIPEKEGEGSFMSGPEIMHELEKHSQKTMAGVTANAFGRSMTRLGVKRVGRHETDGYLVLAA